MFILTIIVGLHIIWNMSWVYKHVIQPSTMWSIPHSTIMNDIILSSVCACENHQKLVVKHVLSQRPFTCATRYFCEWEFHYISDVGKVLVMPQAPSLLKVGWYTWVNGIKANFSALHVIMASTTLFLMKPIFFIPMCACGNVQWLLITTPTNQSYTF
jgi:hypothetical protein